MVDHVIVVLFILVLLFLQDLRYDLPVHYIFKPQTQIYEPNSLLLVFHVVSQNNLVHIVHIHEILIPVHLVTNCLKHRICSPILTSILIIMLPSKLINFFS